MTSGDQPPPTGSRAWVKWWGLILAVLLLCAAGIVTALVTSLKPAFESVDAQDASQIREMTVFVLNRPDGGPDIAHPKKPMVVPPGEYEAVLGVFRNAERIDKERGVYLGQLKVTLIDGRRQVILLYRIAPDPHAPPVLRFKIGGFQYEAGPVERLVKVLAEMEERAKAGPN